MSARCSHKWIFRVSQDGLLHIRFCLKCAIGEYIDENRGWSSMRYCEDPDRKTDPQHFSAKKTTKEQRL